MNFGGNPSCCIDFHIVSLSILSKAFWKSTNTEYRGLCHSNDCSMMILIVAMWSVHDLSWRKPACSSRSFLSRAVFSCSKIILVNALPGIDSSMIPLQLLQDDISPFFGSFTICPFFQSCGTCSCSHTLFRSGYNISVDV